MAEIILKIINKESNIYKIKEREMGDTGYLINLR